MLISSTESSRWILLLISLASFALATGNYSQCYVKAGVLGSAEDRTVPCLNSGQSSCCAAGDICLSGNACYSAENAIVYQYGCTDSTYQDASCPYKCGWDSINPVLGGIGSPLKYCPGPNGDSDTWICQCPNSTVCYEGHNQIVLPSQACEEFGSNARVALFAPQNLAPYISLPFSGSTAYYSPTVVSGTSTWRNTVVSGYTPSPVTQFTDYGPQPTTPVIYSPSQSPSTTASPASAPTATSPTNNDDTSQGSVRHGLSIEAKAGIVLGVAGGLIIAAIFVVPYLLWKRRESNRSKNPSRRTSKVHWLAPAMMLASFIAGSCLAIGHHLFYQSLNGTSVNSDPTQILGTTFSDQELNIGVGTALSFLVKTFLVLAISIAYVQCFWVIARAYQSHKAMSISDLDAAFSVLNDFLAFKRVLLWLRKPLLLLLALAAWLIPIASVFTPGTLSVQPQAKTPVPTKEAYVPYLDFRSLSFSAAMFDDGQALSNSQGAVYTYSGPSLAVQNVVSATAAHGSILTIPDQGTNSSWTIEFLGPSLSCHNVSYSLANQFLDEINREVKKCDEGTCVLFQDPRYVSWFQPSQMGPINGTVLGTPADSVTYTPPGIPNATTFVALLPPTYDHGPLPTTDNSTILQCDLIESTYSAGFHFIDGHQTVSVNLTEPSETLPIITSVLVNGLAQTQFQQPQGGSSTDHRSGFGACVTIASGLNYTNFEGSFIPNCEADSSILRGLSYQSVLYAFNKLILGSIYTGEYVNTSILSTSLSRAPEFQFLSPEAINSDLSVSYHSYDLQTVLAMQPDHSVQGLFTADSPITNQTLAELIEELFQNITISLMSSPTLLPNRTSITAPAMATVSLHTYHNVYVYAAWKLWVPYGIAILIAAWAVFVGYVSIWYNRATYSNEFSTILRVAGAAELDVAIKRPDMDGHDPLPEYIGKASFTFAEDPLVRKRKIWPRSSKNNASSSKTPTTVSYTNVQTNRT